MAEETPYDLFATAKQNALEAAAAAAEADDDALLKIASALEALARGLQLQNRVDAVRTGRFDRENDRYVPRGSEGEASPSSGVPTS